MESFLLHTSVSITVHVRVYKIFSEQTEENSHSLVNVVQCLAMVSLQGHEDLHDCGGSSQNFFSLSRGVEQAVHEVPGQPQKRLGHLVVLTARTADCSSHRIKFDTTFYIISNESKRYDT